MTSTIGMTSAHNPTSQGTNSNDQILQPIHYICIVLLFYMGGLTVLIIKYIQSENVEARYQQYYNDYVKRPGFKRPRLMKEIRPSSVEGCLNERGVTKLTDNASFYHNTTGNSEEKFGKSFYISDEAQRSTSSNSMRSSDNVLMANSLKSIKPRESTRNNIEMTQSIKADSGIQTHSYNDICIFNENSMKTSIV